MFETINHGWGQLIAEHPYKHMIVSLIVMFLLSLGVININVENDIRASFSPPNSRASYENKVYKEFFNLTVPPQRAFVLFSAKDNASMIREQQLKDVLKFDKYFNDILSRISPESGLAGCSPLCNLNQPFHLISNEMFKMYDSVNKTPSNDLILDFPMSTYKGQNIFIGMNLAGAQTSNHLFPSNNSRIISVKTIILWYFSRADTKSTKEILREKSIELFEHAKNGSYLDNVKFEIFGDEIANREMVRGAIEATTLMSIGVFLLIGVVSLSTYRRLKGSGFSAISLVVFVSVLSPFLASAAAFGILTWLGNKVYTIMCVTPFLVLGVGVDDAFILIECWTNSKYIKSKKERISAVLVNIGPSITITSLTNTIAFGIGYATPTPQMSLFCLCTSIALFVDYILVFTFLTPAIYLLTKEDADTEIHPTSKKELLQLSEFRPRKLPRFVEWYADFVTSKKGIFSVALFLTCIYVISYFGVVTMKSNFEPSKAFPSDSPLANSMDTVRSVFNEFFPINIIVNHPPNITNSTEVKILSRPFLQ